MQLVKVARLPKGAKKDGPPVRMQDHGGATVQDYRLGDDLYEQVTRDSGEVLVYLLMPIR